MIQVMIHLYLLKLQIIGMLPLRSCSPSNFTFMNYICCALLTCLNLSLASTLQLVSLFFPLLDPSYDLVEPANAPEIKR